MREALKLALEFVSDIQRGKYKGDAEETITAVKQALAAPVQKPVCIGWDDKTDTPVMGYPTPPAAQPAPEQYTALEQALTRLQKRYSELEAKAAAQPAPVQEPVAFVKGWNCGRLEVIVRSLNQKFEHDQPLYITPPAAQPAPVREPVGRTDRQIVDQTEELAVWLLSWCFNHQPETATPMRESTHPFAERCWAAACHIQEMLTATDPENAVAELDVDATSPAAPVQEPVAWMDASGDIYKHDLWYDWNPPHTPLYTTPPAAQPAVPDAINDNSESPEYRSGWNDCRALMLEMRKP